MNCHFFPTPFMLIRLCLLGFRRAQEQLRQLLFRVLMVMHDLIDRRTDWQLHPELTRQIHQGLNRIDALSQFGERLARDEILTEPAVVAMRREQRRLVIAQMRQAIHGHLIATHLFDEP